jgi:hypothetical protein
MYVYFICVLKAQKLWFGFPLLFLFAKIFEPTCDEMILFLCLFHNSPIFHKYLLTKKTLHTKQNTWIVETSQYENCLRLVFGRVFLPMLTLLFEQ